ncbi:MAG: hypothetical protein COB02_01465 [Candidatus Cloacimonadota bacterium]|nr:MAG: hypothetical protein COB02_01465 [Candidatus Cloacimonadota bacterium]
MKLLLYFILSIGVFAGSAGVRNGTIRGTVLDDSNNILQGAYVITQFEGDPPFQRNAMTNSEGIYVFNNMPVGSYTIGFSKNGYQSHTLSEGPPATNDQHGNIISAYVESGATYTVSPVRLSFLGASGQAIVRLKLVDSYTGEVVKDSQVILGATSSNGSSNGFHETTVSVTPNIDGLPNLPLIINTPGYEGLEEQIQAIPNEVNEFTVELTPHLSAIQGRVELNGFPFPKLLSNAHISVDNIDIEKVNAKVDSGGFFHISVPASTDKNKRSFNVRIHLQGFQDIIISNIISPIAGATTIQQTIKLTPITIMVRGQVTSSSGIAPKVSAMNQAFIKELGISANIQNGFFSFLQIPTSIPLSLKIIQLNIENEVEVGEAKFTAIRNGTNQFIIPGIISTSTKK